MEKNIKILSQKFNRFIKSVTPSSDLKNLTHVYTYNDDELSQHFAREIRKIELTKKDLIVLLGSAKHINEVQKLSSINNKYFITIIADTKTPIKNIYKHIIGKKTKNIKCIVIVDDEPKFVRKWTMSFLDKPTLKSIPIIFKISVANFHQASRRFDVLPQDIGFIDDNLDYDFFYNTYKKSLEIFHQKCQIKDAWDIYQSLYQTRKLTGNIIEVGSYKGHSGWLIDKFAHKHSKIKRQIYLCDMFSEFPDENIGLDTTWSHSHKVNFNSVKRRFLGNKNVTFVKGDIRNTLPSLNKNKWSFAFIDVDSYDATKAALEQIFPRLQKGGIILCEDYGESHCLGARIATDRYFVDKNVISFFSFFSGCKAYFKI